MSKNIDIDFDDSSLDQLILLVDSAEWTAHIEPMLQRLQEKRTEQLIGSVSSSHESKIELIAEINLLSTLRGLRETLLQRKR